MRVFATDQFPLRLTDGHFFPADKYRLVREAIEAEGLAIAEIAAAATDDQLLLAHGPDYVHRVQHGQLTRVELRRLGFPWSPELVERSRRSCGSTIAASLAAVEDCLAVYLGGGTHHAFADAGEGYCVFNDAVVAARVLQRDGLASRLLIVDCDAHQGNGTAAMTASDPSIFTFSMHGERSFPTEKVPSDLDIALPIGVGDLEYLARLEEGLAEAMARAEPDFVIYLAGADPHAEDRIGRMSLTLGGLRHRDEHVLSTCARAGRPVAVTLAGGYGRTIESTVAVHVQTVRIAARFTDRRSVR